MLRGGKIVPTAKTRIGPHKGSPQDAPDIKTQATTELIRVALIEDDESVRQALAFQLRTAGFEVAAYSSAEGLLEAADTKEFDCVVADIYLPKMNGLQLQEELNRRFPRKAC
jgi:FixJ family two-component response regulator